MTRVILLTLGLATLPVGHSLRAEAKRDVQGSTNELSWFTIGGGGATRLTTGAFHMTSTIGQPGATSVALMAGEFELSGGFLAAGLPSASLCPADLNNDGVVNAADLALLLGTWGACE